MTKNILLSALVLFGVVSCVKDPFDESLGERVTITLTAENPGFGDTKTKTSSADSSAVEGRIVYEDSSLFICAPQSMEPSTKTGMTTDGTPFWEFEDKISVVTKSDKTFENNVFTSDVKEGEQAKATNFTGSVLPSGYTDAFAFYPYNKDAVITSTEKDVSVTLTIPSNQTPKYASSFDGKADILVSKKLSAPSAKDLDGSQLEFTRKVGFLKIGLYDSDHNVLNEKIISLSVTAPDKTNLVGACQLNLTDGTLSALSTGNNNSVTVKYPDEGTSTVLLSIYPQTINNDTKLTFHCETVDPQKVRKTYNITKKIGADIIVDANKYTFLGLIPAESNEVENISKNNAWLNFIESNAAMEKSKGNMEEYNRILSERILLDYSYAGYKRGTAVPPELVTTGSEPQVYNVNNIKIDLQNKYPKITVSDRQAFMHALHKAGIYNYDENAVQNNSKVGKPIKNANGKGAVIYFPKRTEKYVLHNSSDDGPSASYVDNRLSTSGYDKPNNLKSNPIIITAGNFIIAGDGPGKTIIEMENRNNPVAEPFYATKEMILIKNPKTDIEDESGAIAPSSLASVKSDAVKGSFSVQLDRDPGMGENDWVILCLENTQPTNPLLNYELGGHEVVSGMMENIQKTVSVRDYHQVKSWDQTTMTLTFYEPIMRDIDLERDGKSWAIYKYNNYSDVGVENLTFLGHAPEEFLHHGGNDHMHDPWLMDGGYKPLTMTGLVNSWVRNVQFVSISECLRFKMCANSSAYNIEIKGNRGHAGVSSAGSSRMFIGNINDHSDGYRLVKQEVDAENPGRETGAGQYHASGVSKPSMGAVLWKNQWGQDATFESHSGQPRATLVDNCTGGWVESRFGGDRQEIPNHLNDLTIWNMNATTYRSPNYGMEPFKWWTDNPAAFWRVVPPIVVGFHGAVMDETLGQMKYYEEGCGVPSLYKAQLQERAKREPDATLQDWLTELDRLKLPNWEYPTTN